MAFESRNRDPLFDLVQLFARLPGIGERTATRLAFHVLGSDREYATALGESLAKIHERIRRCEVCGNYGAESRCTICLDSTRDSSILCVLARVQDLVAIERSASFRGRYHVLHGLLAPLDGIGPDQLSLTALCHRVEREHVREVVIATPPSVEGEATALYIAQTMKTMSVRLSRIASGIPHGAELEFTDQVTLGRAFDDRREL